MGTVLWLISLCLNIAAFYWILILSQRVKAMEEDESTYNQLELHEQLEEHIEALRKENLRFIQAVEDRLSKESPASSFEALFSEDPSQQYVSLDKQKKIYDALDLVFPSKKVEEISEEENSLPKEGEGPVDVMETSVMSQILHLKDEGISPENIAKQLGIGKGEVALMLKLHEKR